MAGLLHPLSYSMSTSWSRPLQGPAGHLAAVPDLLPLLHSLEGARGGQLIAPLAETLLDEVAAANEGAAATQVQALRAGTRAAKAERAARTRARMLAACGIGAGVSRRSWFMRDNSDA